MLSTPAMRRFRTDIQCGGERTLAGYPVRIDHGTSVRHVEAAVAVPLVASPLAYEHPAIIIHTVPAAVSAKKSVMTHRNPTK